MKIDNRFKIYIRRLYGSLAERRFLPATLALVSMVLSVGAIQGTWYDRLPNAVRLMFGHSPAHTTDGSWHRIFTSLPLTGDPYHLIAAALMTLVCVGGLEYRRGPGWSLAFFFGSHVMTVLLESLLLSKIVAWQQHSPFHWMLTSSDVGPSAGYYGCLAGCLIGVPWKPRIWLTIGLLCWLFCRLLVSLYRNDQGLTEVQSDLAHLIAVSIGLFFAGICFTTKDTETKACPADQPHSHS